MKLAYEYFRKFDRGRGVARVTSAASAWLLQGERNRPDN